MYQSASQDPSQTPARRRRFTLFVSLPALVVVCGLLAGTAQAPVAKAVATAETHDLSPTERETVCAARVTSGLARDRDVEPGCGDESTFASPEEPGRVRKCENFTLEVLLES